MALATHSSARHSVKRLTACVMSRGLRARQRLAEHQGVDLDAAGPDVLTADTWALLRLDREVPGDRHAIGIPLARLGVVIAEIEAL